MHSLATLVRLDRINKSLKRGSSTNATDSTSQPAASPTRQATPCNVLTTKSNSRSNARAKRHGLQPCRCSHSLTRHATVAERNNSFSSGRDRTVSQGSPNQPQIRTSYPSETTQLDFLDSRSIMCTSASSSRRNRETGTWLEGRMGDEDGD
jgi:hypothetical protein